MEVTGVAIGNSVCGGRGDSVPVGSGRDVVDDKGVTGIWVTGLDGMQAVNTNARRISSFTSFIIFTRFRINKKDGS